MRPTLKKTLELILESGHDYVVSLKGNQASLLRQVKSMVTHCQALHPTLTTQEQHRGRRETRSLQVFSAAGIDTDLWPGVKTVLCIDRQQLRRGKLVSHRAFYISSLMTSPTAWMTLIRGHWSVENRLHWPKDVILDEDRTYGRHPNALLNASVFRSITINLLRLNGFDSLKPALRQLANQIHQIFLLLQ